jgi:hypothetical protein
MLTRRSIHGEMADVVAEAAELSESDPDPVDVEAAPVSHAWELH